MVRRYPVLTHQGYQVPFSFFFFFFFLHFIFLFFFILVYFIYFLKRSSTLSPGWSAVV
uniref:Macaca fascicularis brain cDNA clone: QmoA-12119, similar to human period homolog 2 (Drosophila) (PER2), transcript variant1, mRNA, RefSeq: NM_022817.1 n=1 Tax=Macaca fascicularis TaxID=9541 RepID=I7GJ65_MACFA|nr:unnamed protein product [Macaca fascicularis]